MSVVGALFSFLFGSGCCFVVRLYGFLLLVFPTMGDAWHVRALQVRSHEKDDSNPLKKNVLAERVAEL